MKTRLVRGAAVGALVVIATGCYTEPSPSLLFALHYAPVVYQDTDDSNAKADYITAFTFDHNWTADDNWDNLDANQSNLIAYVYYSIAETDDYWFIVYAFFHPRDWDVPTHENDMEGLLAIVENDRSEYGRLIGVITVAHTDFWSYTPTGSPLGAGQESIDGTLTLDTLDDGARHPRISIQAKGHGVKAWPYTGSFDGDLIVYEPDLTDPYGGSLPPSGDPDDVVHYGLINIGGIFWTRQMLEAFVDRDDADTFANWGTLKGDCAFLDLTCGEDKANLPWKWDDTGSHTSEPDGVPGGLLGLDPAWISDVYFSGFVAQNRYVSNEFLTDLQRAGFNRDHLPDGWPEELDIGELLARAP
jgi:hypothetical protein